MISTPVTRDQSSPQTAARSLWKSGALAGVVSAALNAGIFAIAVAAGIFPALTFQPDAGAQMSAEPIVFVSVLGALAGVWAFTLLRSRVSEPVRTFLRIAAVVLVLSLAAPFAIPGTSLVQGIVINVLHVVVAGGVVWAVLRGERAR